MAAVGASRRVSAASARAHTRKSTPKSSSSGLAPFHNYGMCVLNHVCKFGLFKTLLIVSLIGLVAWAYQATRPPPPKICGTPDGPPITAPRVKLSDGRHLAYKEHGVPKDKAQYKFVYIHGFDSCRLHSVVGNYLSPETMERLGVYIVAIDRPGYCESDPSPNWTMKSIALDVEEFADKLELGKKFYLIGFSMGGQATWSCLKYIPHRLAGATLLAPVVNYWWSGLPSNLSAQALNAQIPQDRWALRVVHYAPWLTYWWNTQKFFPPIGVIAHPPEIFSRQDKELIKQVVGKEDKSSVRQQGDYESLHRDLILGFSTWEFDPTELENPFPNNEGRVHLWQGDEDVLVPVILQRYIAEKLPWIHYHEVQGGGHLFPYSKGMSDTIVKTQLSVE